MGGAWSLYARLNYPAQNPGTKISRLAGTATFVVSSAALVNGTIRFDTELAAHDVRTELGHSAERGRLSARDRHEALDAVGLALGVALVGGQPHPERVLRLVRISDATAQVLRLQSSGADVIATLLYPPEAAVFLRDALKYGLKGPFLGTVGTTDIKDLAEKMRAETISSSLETTRIAPRTPVWPKSVWAAFS